MERLWGLLKTATTRAVWEDLVEQRRPIAEALAEHFFPLVQRLAVSTNLLMVTITDGAETHRTLMPELYAADKDFSDVWISDGLMLSVHFNGDGPGWEERTRKHSAQPAPLGVQVPPKPKPDDTHQE